MMYFSIEDLLDVVENVMSRRHNGFGGMGRVSSNELLAEITMARCDMHDAEVDLREYIDSLPLITEDLDEE
jgi:hypothetical protein